MTDQPSAPREPDPQVGFRCPKDLDAALTRRARQIGVKRSAIIVAALRRHLSLPSPADTPEGERL